MKTIIEFKRHVRNNPKQKKEILFYGSGSKFWRLNGEYHREDGPAIEYCNGTKHWFLNGKPCYSYCDELEEYKKKKQIALK